MAKFGINDWLSGTKQADGGYALATASGALGPQTSADSQSITPATDALFKLAGSYISATASFTPTAVAYSANNTMGVAQIFMFTLADGSAVPATAGIRILSSTLKIDETAIISGETGYALQAYGVTPPSALANNTAWTLSSADLPSYQGSISIGTPADLGAACFIKTSGIDQQLKLTAGGVYMYLQTLGAFTSNTTQRQIILEGIIL